MLFRLCMIQGVLAAVLWSDEQHFKKYNSPTSSELVGKLFLPGASNSSRRNFTLKAVNDNTLNWHRQGKQQATVIDLSYLLIMCQLYKQRHGYNSREKEYNLFDTSEHVFENCSSAKFGKSLGFFWVFCFILLENKKMFGHRDALSKKN